MRPEISRDSGPRAGHEPGYQQGTGRDTSRDPNAPMHGTPVDEARTPAGTPPAQARGGKAEGADPAVCFQGLRLAVAGAQQARALGLRGVGELPPRPRRGHGPELRAQAVALLGEAPGVEGRLALQGLEAAAVVVALALHRPRGPLLGLEAAAEGVALRL